MKQQRVKSAWDKFNQRYLETYPKPLRESQRLIMQLCFYSGAEGVLKELSEMYGDCLSDDAEVSFIESLFDECEEFKNSLRPKRIQ